MNHASLAARYRPQTFADLTGQETVKTILSRAAAEDRVAPAYLLSGTRGVGKTTIARVFAKALNCAQAPTAEPCNQCEQCRRITQGAHVDVVEIDGASNRGIDDARRLRDAIGYSPLEGRYKVFIIDEAHMLTRDAFNALLKTLEEPPPRVTFILATTEPHKFPVTIVSRCQHFIFKAIPEQRLAEHVAGVLGKEAVPFEDSAVRLIARRAAGSVRDAMSLLGQTLALGGDALTEAAVRSVLGLAGQELFERLLTSVRSQDCVGVAALTRELLERGVDLGFFLRELAQLWRNLFLLRQSGEAALTVVDLPEGESRRLLILCEGFELSVIHAAWQLVLEGQRQVLTSLEPAAALELLLLNLALLPRLASLDQFRGASGPLPVPSAVPSAPAVPVAVPAAPAVPSAQASAAGTSSMGGDPRGEHRAGESALTPNAPAAPATPPPALVPATPAPPVVPADTETLPPAAPLPDEGKWPATWEAFLAHCSGALAPDGPLSLAHLQQIKGKCEDGALVLHTESRVSYEMFNTAPRLECLRRMASQIAGKPVDVRLTEPTRVVVPEAVRREEAAKHPAVQVLLSEFDAQLSRCMDWEDVGIAGANEPQTK